MAPSLAVGNLDGEISVWKTSSSCGTWPVLEIWNVYLPTARFVEDNPTRKSLSATGTGEAGVDTLAAGTAGPVAAGAAAEAAAGGEDRTFRLDSSMARDPSPMAMMLPKMAIAEQPNMTIVQPSRRVARCSNRSSRARNASHVGAASVSGRSPAAGPQLSAIWVAGGSSILGAWSIVIVMVSMFCLSAGFGPGPSVGGCRAVGPKPGKRAPPLS